MSTPPARPRSHWTEPARRLRRLNQLVAATRRSLQQRRWLRVHVFTIALLTLGCLWLASALLMHAGVASLALRYALAVGVAYAAYLGMLRLWAGWLARQDERNREWEVPDPGNLQADGGPASPAASDGPAFESGGGGDFAGGGATGSWGDPQPVASGTRPWDGPAGSWGDPQPVASGTRPWDGPAGSWGDPQPVASGTRPWDGPAGSWDASGEPLSTVAEGAGSVLDAADEGIVVAVPLAILVGVAALLWALLGAGVLSLFGVEVLMAVTVEVVLASLAGSLAFKGQAEGWLGSALAHTWRGALTVLAACVLLGLAIDLWLPGAQSLAQALVLLQAQP